MENGRPSSWPVFPTPLLILKFTKQRERERECTYTIIDWAALEGFFVAMENNDDKSCQLLLFKKNLVN